MNATDRLSVVIPVHNGSATLPRLLRGLMDTQHPPVEVIVVDDGSDDTSAQIAVDFGARLLSLEGGPYGPAYARNRGAEAASGAVLFFLDADVTVREDTVPRLREALKAYPDYAAFFGSYDAHPPAPGLISKYKNLLHHYVHQHSQVEAGTFWAGCGAIRRDAFFAVDGFDESYMLPAIEDIELGTRLRRAGYRIRLCPDIQVTHWKHWSLISWLRTDICHRAVPWTRLILNEGHLPAGLNLNRGSRWSALLVWLTIFLFLMVPVSPLLSLMGLVTYGGFAWLNRNLIRFFARSGGRAFALGATLLQSLYLAYSSATFGTLAFLRLLERRALPVLLLATLFNGLVWSVATPPLHGPDENYHFSYVQLLANERTLEVRPDRWFKEELGLLMQVGQYHIRGISEGRVKTLDLSDHIKIEQQIEALKNSSVQSTYHNHDGWMFRRLRIFVAYHPPIYYAVIAGAHKLLSHQSILVRLLAGRWISVVLSLVSVWAAYRIGENLWPRTPARTVLLGVLVSFQPMHTFVTSIVNNGALEIALFSLLLLVTLEVVDHGLTVKRGVQIGLIVGFGLLTRISFLASLPVLGLLLLWQWGTRWYDKSWRTGLVAWMGAGALTAILAGWWYVDKFSGAGRVLVDTFRAGEPTLEIPLLSYLIRYGWLTIYRSVLKMYWGNFGWLHTPIPDNLRTVLILLTVIAAWSGGWWLLRKAVASADRESRVAVFRFALLGLAALAFVAFYTYLDYRFARRGSAFGIQGRYFLPPIAGQMAWFLVGLSVAVPARIVKLWQWLLGVGMVVLNGYALYAVVVPRYYPVNALMEFPRQAALLQPLGPLALRMLMIGQFLFAALLIVTLWCNRRHLASDVPLFS